MEGDWFRCLGTTKVSKHLPVHNQAVPQILGCNLGHASSTNCSWSSPDVDDVTLSVTVPVLILDDVTVSSIELTVERRVHQNLIGSFNSPDLHSEKVQVRTGFRGFSHLCWT